MKGSGFYALLDGPFDGTVKDGFVIIVHAKNEAPIDHDTKIVQPAEQGIVKEILVKEGELVKEGQPLIRMDAVLAEADIRSIQSEHDNKRLALRRIDAQLSGRKFPREKGDPDSLFHQVAVQYTANVQAYENAIAQEKSLLGKAKHDLAGAQATRAKLEQVLPHYVAQAEYPAAAERLEPAGS